MKLPPRGSLRNIYKSCRALRSYHGIMPDQYILMEYIGGMIYQNLKHKHWLTRMLSVYEYDKLEYFVETIKPGDRIIDVGAHLGFYSLLFCSVIGSEGFVHAFEPYIENACWLHQSIDANKYENIRVYLSALSDSNRIAKFNIQTKESTGGGSIATKLKIHEKDSVNYVSVQKLDDYIDIIGPVDYIKIDVEHEDLRTLRGATKFLEKFKPTVIMDMHCQEDEIINFFHDIGYDVTDMSTRKPVSSAKDVKMDDIIATAK